MTSLKTKINILKKVLNMTEKAHLKLIKNDVSKKAVQKTYNDIINILNKKLYMLKTKTNLQIKQKYKRPRLNVLVY